MKREFVQFVVMAGLLTSLVVGCGQVPSGEFHEIKSVPGTPVTDHEATTPTESEGTTSAAKTETTTAQDPASEDAPKTAATEPTQAVKPDASIEPIASEPIKVLVTEKEFSVVGPDDALRVTFEDIDLEKILDVTAVTKDAPKYFPGWLKDLDGKRVRIRGFMRPAFQESDIRAFTLCRDTSVCCFGPNPKVCYLIDTIMRKGKTTEYIENRPFEVVGLFHIGTSISPGELFTLDDAIVITK